MAPGWRAGGESDDGGAGRVEQLVDIVELAMHRLDCLRAAESCRGLLLCCALLLALCTSAAAALWRCTRALMCMSTAACACGKLWLH